MKLMKQTLKVLVLTVALVISGLVLAPSPAKAQECTWTLYVNGTEYTTSSSYYSSGQLIKSGSTVTLNNFTGKSIQAIPGGSYGDDDAPQLTIVVNGTCTLSGGTLDDGSYGMIYVEPRSGGSGAGSKVTIQGSGTLNLTCKDYSYTRAQNADYNLISADNVSLSGQAVYNLTADIYGQYSGTTLYGVKSTNITYFTASSQVNMTLRTGIAQYAAGASTIEYKSAGSVMGVKGWLIHNSSNYASIDTNASENSTKDIHCGETVSANGSALYLMNISGVKPYTTLNNSGKTEYTASDANRYYTALVPTGTSSGLKQISLSDIVSEAKFSKSNTFMESDSVFTARTTKGYYEKTGMYRREISDGQVWMNQDMFYASSSLEYAYEADIQTVPMPGYQIVSDDMTSAAIAAEAEKKFGYSPDFTKYSSTSAKTVVVYSYVIPTVTKQPASVYDIGNLSNVSIAAETPTESCVWEQEFTMSAGMKYEWFLRVYSDESTYQDFTMETFGGDMDGFDDLDTVSPSLGFDDTYKEFTVTVNGKGIKLGDAAKLEIFCKVSTIADSINSNRAQLLLDHTSEVIPAQEATCTDTGLTAGEKCAVCGQILKAQTTVPALGHDAVALEDKAATCTETGSTGGKACSRCHVVMEASTVVPAKGHHEVAMPDVQANLTTDGSVGGTYCDVCNATIKEAEVISHPTDIALDVDQFTYSGKVNTPAVVVRNGKQEVIDATNYDVAYSSNGKNVGTYTATVTFKGNYSGETVLSFTVVPKATSIRKLTALRKGFKITWKKQSPQVTGYEIRYSTKSSMAKAKTAKVTKYRTTKKSISKLTRKKKYYVQIRTFKKVKGVLYYSAWSKKKAVKTK